MSDLLNEVFSLMESDARWLNDAAQYFEDYANQLNDGEKPKWELLAAVYRERAQVSQNAVGKAIQNPATDGASASHSENR
jgi:hypothetical protein